MEARTGHSTAGYRDFWLAAGGLFCAAVVGALLVSGRPVNDDYWAFGSQIEGGFWGSLAWYYTEFQGNVVSWFFILLHEQQWFTGVTLLGSAGSILVFFLLMSWASWGGLSFLGVELQRGWRRLAVLAMAAVAGWLSLESVVGPNSTTAIYYMPSTIVHIWPWLFCLVGLGLVFRETLTHFSLVLAVFAGFMAGSLGFVEGVIIGGATLAMVLWALKWKPSPVHSHAAWSWIIGLLGGLLVQVASPATWGRGGGLGSEGALTTNVQAVERLLSMAQARLGSGLVDSILGIADVDVWARVLVPFAALGDLILRPGLLAIIFIVAWWSTRGARTQLPRRELRKRLAIGLFVVTAGFLAYSASGALYAYAGRHAAGLALGVTLLAVGWTIYRAPLWERWHKPVSVAGVAGVMILVALSIQQVSIGISRMVAWDQAFLINRERILDGRYTDLVDVAYRAGVSSSGLRDHGSSGSYIEWIQRNLAP